MRLTIAMLCVAAHCCHLRPICAAPTFKPEVAENPIKTMDPRKHYLPPNLIVHPGPAITATTRYKQERVKFPTRRLGCEQDCSKYTGVRNVDASHDEDNKVEPNATSKPYTLNIAQYAVLASVHFLYPGATDVCFVADVLLLHRIKEKNWRCVL